MNRLRLVVLVGGSGRTLQNLVDLARKEAESDGATERRSDGGNAGKSVGEGGAGEEPWEVVLVIGSKPGLMGLDRAVAADIPTSIVQRKSYVSVEAFSESIFTAADIVRADLVVLAGWLSLLAVPPRWAGRVVNIHPSLLPSFGGKGMYGHHVHQAVLAAGEKTTGCTVHFVDNGYDTGPHIVQRTCPVLPADTPDTLAARVFEEEKLAYPAALRLIAARKHSA